MSQQIYDAMWQRFEQAANSNSFELDPHLLDIEQDNRRGITALAYLNQANSGLIKEIGNFISAVQDIEPEQYFYPSADLHLTLLSVISCQPYFTLDNIEVQPYIEIFHQVLAQSKPVEIQFKGVTASPNCIVLQGFPVDNALPDLRNNLRKQLSDAGLTTSFDTRYKLETAHSSMIRLKTPVQKPEQLLALCQKFKQHEFGRFLITDFALVFNNWYQNQSETKTLAKASALSQ